MNAFLLKIAEDELAELAHLTGRESECAELRQMSRELYDNIQKHAWKGNFFARAMINSEREGGYTYVGASATAFPPIPISRAPTFSIRSHGRSSPIPRARSRSR